MSENSTMSKMIKDLLNKKKEYIQQIKEINEVLDKLGYESESPKVEIPKAKYVSTKKPSLNNLITRFLKNTSTEFMVSDIISFVQQEIPDAKYAVISSRFNYLKTSKNNVVKKVGQDGKAHIFKSLISKPSTKFTNAELIEFVQDYMDEALRERSGIISVQNLAKIADTEITLIRNILSCPKDYGIEKFVSHKYGSQDKYQVKERIYS